MENGCQKDMGEAKMIETYLSTPFYRTSHLQKCRSQSNGINRPQQSRCNNLP